MDRVRGVKHSPDPPCFWGSVIVLGLDPSLTGYGWAIHDSSGSGSSRCLKRGHWKTRSDTVEVCRYMHQRDALVHLLDQHPEIQKVALESPAFGASYSEGMYALFMFTHEALWIKGMDFVLLGITQVKKHALHALGRPDGWQMEKADMVEAAKKDTQSKGRWNHNEADAYLIGVLGGRFWDFRSGALDEDELTEYERELIVGQHTFSRGKRAGETEYKGLMFREGERFFLWSSHK